MKPEARNLIITGGLFALWVTLPILISVLIYRNYEEKNNPVSIVVVQPNLDPYSEQYTMEPKEVLSRMMALAGPEIDSSTNFLVAPESAIQQQMWENELDSFESILILKKMVSGYLSMAGRIWRIYIQQESSGRCL